MSKALQKSRQTTSIALSLSTDVVTPSQKATRLVRQDLPLVKPCWLSRITSLPSMCLSIASRRICSMIFPGTEILSPIPPGWRVSLKICQLCSAPLSLRAVSQGILLTNSLKSWKFAFACSSLKERIGQRIEK
ncbi:hypothetical protein QYF61_021202, partial [Mycteria americana]